MLAKMRAVLWPIFLFWSQLPMWSSSQRSQPICHIKCGVVVMDQQEDRSWFDLVKKSWNLLAAKRGISDVEMQFVPVHRSPDFTMDMLIEAYMEIGVTNISAMIGPYVAPLATAIEKVGIPYFVTTPVEHKRYRPFNMITVSPDALDMLQVAAQTVDRYRWSNIVVIYDSDEGVHLIERLVLLNSLRLRSWRVRSNMTDPELREILLTIRQLNLKNILLYTLTVPEYKLLNMALRLSMLAINYYWILPDVNVNLAALEPFMFTQVNLTSLQLVQSRESIDLTLMPKGFSKHDVATTMDSLLAFYDAVRLHYQNKRDCNWNGRKQIAKILPQLGDTGATGQLSFHPDGKRRSYIVDILTLSQTHMVKIGHWDSAASPKNQLFLNISFGKPKKDKNTPKKNYPFGREIINVATMLEDPFMKYSTGAGVPHSASRFEGFCMDVIHELQEILDFKYKVYLKKEFGTRTKNGSWTGLIGELLNGNATMVIGHMTVSSEREEFIDFTKPFKKLSVSVLIKRPTDETSVFQFLQPLSTLLWVIMLVMIGFFTVSLYVIDRLSPAHTHTDNQTQLGVQRCIWFVFSSMVLREGELNPQTISGKILAGSLWSFALMLVSSYTASLAAFLVVSNLQPPLRTMADLTRQDNLKYGSIANTHVSAFLRNSRIDPFRRIWQDIKASPNGLMVKDINEALQLVHSGKFAFIWDSSEIRQIVNSDCSLMELGEPFEINSYALAVPQGASYRDLLNRAIIKLEEKGILQELQNRWWPQGICPDPYSVTPTSSQLTMHKLAGLFILLAVGIFLAVMAAILEYFLTRRKKQRKTKNRKIPEESLSTKPLCDGNLGNTSSPQSEEPFLTPSSFTNKSNNSPNLPPNEETYLTATTYRHNHKHETSIF